jgi:eukaryotic-like serine/threonine-protein kinase
MTIASGTKLGRYEIRAKIGEGGMGEVYLARDTQLGRDVAIKVLPSSLAADADRLRRFEQEASAAGALNHPNILIIHHVDTHEGAPYIVSELLEGETLRQRMSGVALAQRRVIDYALLTRGKSNLQRAIEFAAQTASALAGADEQGVVHRDLKPTI